MSPPKSPPPSDAGTAKHTPFPWEYERLPGVVVGPTRCVIATSTPSHKSGDVASPEQQNANGMLMAAAPDLLAVVEAVASFAAKNPWTGLGDSQGYGQDIPAMARAAIRKATEEP